jgi:hypothetical protein
LAALAWAKLMFEKLKLIDLTELENMQDIPWEAHANEGTKEILESKIESIIDKYWIKPLKPTMDH